ncbi:helix-turn-helix domain-containing protein [Methylococcus sp. ANG]|uniref:helix-turn-helix transcriptional regulator n=1 Tax=Methylococcus sp. ANG TaxID=3231903 RepID=UPI003458C07D
MSTEDIGSLPNDALLLDHEAAAILRMSRSTLNSWRVARKGPPFMKIGGAVRYRAADLRDWIYNQYNAGVANK